MTQNKQTQSYLLPFIIMVVLMSLVGLITGLNQQFQAPMQEAYLLMGGGLKNMLTTGIVFAFFLAYLLMGTPSARFIEAKGFKQALMVGLLILIVAFGLYQLSAFVFEQFDAEVFKSTIQQAREAGEGFKYEGAVVIPKAYYVFLLAAFVAGTALTFLQAVLNPYIAACEVSGTTPVTRGAIAGSGNSTMTTIAPLLVTYVIFAGQKGLDISLSSLYIPITVLMALVAVIAVVLSRLSLPTIASTEKKEGEVLEKSVWSFSHLTLGVVAIFMYVGVEVAVGSNIVLYAKSLKLPDTVLPFFEGGLETATLMSSLYWGGMLVGRLCGSFLNKISANAMLAVTSIGAGTLVLVGMLINQPWLFVGAGLFHSVMWGAIFALAIEKLGKYTSAGSGALMMGIFGGAVIPFLQGALADGLGDWQWTWSLVVVGEVYLLYYALVGYKVKQLP